MKALVICTLLLCTTSYALAAETVSADDPASCATVVKFISTDGRVLDEASEITLAQTRTGIVSRSRDGVRLAPGYRYQEIARGGRRIMQIASPSGGTGELECVCQNSHGGTEGVCFPTMVGDDTVKCTSHTNGCLGSCAMNILIPPPPPPQP